jgi:hypothetical protein
MVQWLISFLDLGYDRSMAFVGADLTYTANGHTQTRHDIYERAYLNGIVLNISAHLYHILSTF